MGYKVKKVYIGQNQVRPRSTSWNGDISNPTLKRTATISIDNNATASGLGFSSDGTHMWTTIWYNGAYYNFLNQWTLSTGWDISSTITGAGSIRYANSSYQNYGGETYFSEDGKKIISSYNYNGRYFYLMQWTLNNPFDLSNPTTQQNYESGGSTDLWVSQDGKKMIYSSNGPMKYQELETAWTVPSLSGTQSNPINFSRPKFSPSGEYFYYMSGNYIVSSKLSRAFDLSSTITDLARFNFVENTSRGDYLASTGYTFDSQGRYLYVLGGERYNMRIYQFEL